MQKELIKIIVDSGDKEAIKKVEELVLGEYTINQAYYHRDLILKFHLHGKEIQYKENDEWVDLDSPVFNANHQYRVKPEPIFTNDIGEEFFEGDHYRVWWFQLDEDEEGELHKGNFIELDIKMLIEAPTTTQIYKSPKAALEAGKKLFSN